MMVTDETILIRMKATGCSDTRIAEKLKITEAEVRNRWQKIMDGAKVEVKNGYGEMAKYWDTLCEQYRNTGAFLGIFTRHLLDRMSPGEVEKLLAEAQKSGNAVPFLMEHCIILKPFPPPEVVVEDKAKN